MTGFIDRQIETSAGFANFVAGLLRQGLSPAEATRYAHGLSSVSAEDAGRIASRLFAPDATTLVIAGDASKVLDAVRKVRPEAEVIPIDQLDLDAAELRAR
jgi:zinc protease